MENSISHCGTQKLCDHYLTLEMNCIFFILDIMLNLLNSLWPSDAYMSVNYTNRGNFNTYAYHWWLWLEKSVSVLSDRNKAITTTLISKCIVRKIMTGINRSSFYVHVFWYKKCYISLFPNYWLVALTPLQCSGQDILMHFYVSFLILVSVSKCKNNVVLITKGHHKKDTVWLFIVYTLTAGIKPASSAHWSTCLSHRLRGLIISPYPSSFLYWFKWNNPISGLYAYSSYLLMLLH